MSKVGTVEKRKQSHLEEVLDFCEGLSRRMIISGANLERVQLAVARICHSYRLEDVSIYLLSGYMSLAARDAEGRYASRQVSIPPAGIHLQQLKQLNRLSYTVAEKRPSPERLEKMLDEACKTRDYPDWTVMLCQMIAMSCLCLIFGGGAREVLTVMCVTAALHYIMLWLARPGIDRVVINAITMFITAVVAILMMKAGNSTNGPVVLITVSMLVIPGIPLVNAVRNLLCGNEMNGILQVLKITIETAALGIGIYLALWVFGLREGMNQAVVTPMSNPWLLILLSFFASVNFGVVFQIAPHDLWRAGLGGMLTRIVLLLITPFIGTRLIYQSLAALVAALYAEVLASRRKDPSTYFVYPAIIPLIPGDLFYYSLVGMYLGNLEMFKTNGMNCLLNLLGMSIGFVLSSIIAHYVRKIRHIRMVRSGK